MRIRIEYIAADGREFNNEKECKKYEDNLYNIFKRLLYIVHFYDKNKNRLYINIGRKAWEEDLGTDLLEQVYNECETIEVIKDFDEELTHYIYYHYGTCIPKYKGKYIYNDFSNEWERMET